MSLLALSLALLALQDVRHPEHGLALDVPQGWRVFEEAATGGALRVRVSPAGVDDVAFTVHVSHVAQSATAAAVRDAGVERARGNTALTGLEAFEVPLAGRTASALRADVSGLHVEQLVLIEDGAQLVVELRAPKDAFPDRAPEFAALREAVAWTPVAAPPDPGADERALLEQLVSRLGAELPWAADWDAAAERAREEQRPILVRALMYSGFAIGEADALGPLVEPEVAALVRDHTVPFRLNKGTRVPFEDPALYGIGPLGFGSGWMLCDPDGRVLRETVGDLEAFLRESLPACGYPAPPRAEPSEGDLARAVADLRDGRGGAASERLARWLSDAPADDPRRAEARYRAGQAAAAVGDVARAGDTWQALVRERPGDRWAWAAAQALSSAGFALGRADDGRRAEPALLAEQRHRALEPLAPEEAPRALEDATTWLLDAQQGDGGWFTPAAASEPGRPNELRLAATLLAVRALAAAGDDERARAAATRGWEAARTEHARLRAQPRGPAFMDYGVWSRPLVLRACRDLLDAGLVDRGTVESEAATVFSYLAEMQKPDGGWGYYVTGDVASSAAPATPAMTFTTAAVVHALLDARDVGLEVPEHLVRGGLDLLEAARNADGTFEYWLIPGAPRPGAAVGAAGRGPVCTLALVRGGRLPAESLTGAWARFAEHRATLAAEAGKLLMHCGPGGLGSHYPFFDYLGAAECLAHLPADVRGRRRLELLEVLLAARAVDGSYLDNPLIGRASATAQAVLALACADRG